MGRIIFGLFLLMMSHSLYAQFQFSPGSGIPVRKLNGQLLKYPWVGGISAGQFQQMDLDNDGLQDLVVFDRGDSRFLCWLRKIENGQTVWHYAPDLGSNFPKTEHWIRLIDYDGDGRIDLFTAINGNINVYRNVSTGTVPQFALTFTRLDADFGFGFPIRILVMNMDYPGLDDLDGDGDIDVLAFDNFDIGFINYYRNMAMERYNRRDTFDLVVGSRCYGRFAESQLNSELILGLTADCVNPPSPRTHSPIKQRVNHLGSSLLPMKFNADTLTDLLIGDVEGTGLALALNGGTRDSAIMVQKQTNFPAYDTSAFVPIFPVGFSLDLTGNAKKDLIVTTNDPFTGVMGNHVWLYENRPGQRDSFQLRNKNFLIEDILQYGRYSAPEFADVDNDGIEDLLIAQVNNANQPIILLLKGQSAGGYQLIDTNFLPTKSIPGRIRLGAGDLNNDGKTDLLVGTTAGPLMYFQNTGSNGTIGFQLISSDYQQIQVGGQTSPELADIDGDGLLDLLIGNNVGRIAYFKNTGSVTVPLFSLITDSIGRIDMREGYFISQATVRIADFNNNGSPDLITAGEWGSIQVFPDIRNNVFNKATASSNPLFYYPNTNVTTNARLGAFTGLAVKDMDGDNLPDLFTGSLRGGIEYYRNTSLQVSIDELVVDNLIKVYPNPANETLTLESLTDNTLITGYKIYDISGRMVGQNLSLSASNIHKLETSSLNTGFYLIEVKLTNGRYQFERFIKN